MSDTFLSRIVASTRADLAERAARVPLVVLRGRAASAPAPRPFASALRPTRASSARLIAEVKRASPSKGLLAETLDPVAQARAYEAGGAAVISVLTESHFFLGSLDHLRAVRQAIAIPVLRKDFILDPYQVYEARAVGADALLLICALLDDAQLANLLALTRTLGMEALVEAHNADETRRAVASGASVIGVNSRDLRTFAVDTDVVRHLRPLVPANRVFIAESGIFDALGAARARAWGADAILVGEALMKAADPTAKARELATAPGGATAALFEGCQQPFVKICGLATPEHAHVAVEWGADAIGLVFAPQAPPHRRVTPDQASAIVSAVRETAIEAPTASVAASRESGSSPRSGERRAVGSDDVGAERRLNAVERRGEGSVPLAVGVFVNEPLASLADIARSVPLDVLQLSGDETPGQCTEAAARTGLPVLKALRLRSASDLVQLDAYALAGATIVLDTPAPDGAYGGTGKTGNWQLARQAAERWPILLSGGLTPANVAEAVATVNPRGVDVSSGVETNKVKDPDKIRALVKAAKTATKSETSR